MMSFLLCFSLLINSDGKFFQTNFDATSLDTTDQGEVVLKDTNPNENLQEDIDHKKTVRHWAVFDKIMSNKTNLSKAFLAGINENDAFYDQKMSTRELNNKTNPGPKWRRRIFFPGNVKAQQQKAKVKAAQAFDKGSKMVKRIKERMRNQHQRFPNETQVSNDEPPSTGIQQTEEDSNTKVRFKKVQNEFINKTKPVFEESLKIVAKVKEKMKQRRPQNPHEISAVDVDSTGANIQQGEILLSGNSISEKTKNRELKTKARRLMDKNIIIIKKIKSKMPKRRIGFRQKQHTIFSHPPDTDAFTEFPAKSSIQRSHDRKEKLASIEGTESKSFENGSDVIDVDIMGSSIPKLLRKNKGDFVDKRGKLRKKDEWPIVYCKEYNVNMCGFEKLAGSHPFDVQKLHNIFSFLKSEHMLSAKSISVPEEADELILLLVHTQRYLNSLKTSRIVANIIEMPAFAYTPNFLLNSRLLKPLRFQVGGSILAGELALHRGWAVNIGGGFHHASADQGGSFCAYADVTLLIRWLFKFYPDLVRTAMIVDLDARQGNGHETDFFNDKQVFIMDVFNKDLLPQNDLAKEAENCKIIELESQTSDSSYLAIVETNLENLLSTFRPDIIVYNAGTDIFHGDPMANLAVSAQGIIKRDEIVFRKAKDQGVPIVMLTGGGYAHQCAGIVVESILNLEKLNLISK